MNEQELIRNWQKNRQTIVVAQFAPTALLGFAAFATPAIRESGFVMSLAFALILLASGILGALAEYSAAAEAQATIDDLRALPGDSAQRRRITSFRPWLEVVKFVTPAIFVAIFAVLLFALFG